MHISTVPQRCINIIQQVEFAQRIYNYLKQNINNNSISFFRVLHRSNSKYIQYKIEIIKIFRRNYKI